MKKVLILVAILAFVCLLVCPVFGAFSETETSTTAPVVVEETPDTTMYTWVYLGSTAGATVAVLLIVQYTKSGLDKLVKIPTRLYVYVLSLVILVAANWFTVGLTLSSGLLLVVNAMVVAAAAMKTYDLTYAKSET